MKNNQPEIDLNYILELIENTPNDYDLGKIIRSKYSKKNIEDNDIYNKK
jgi:hypothetical protein